jgi:hypothetical protein
VEKASFQTALDEKEEDVKIAKKADSSSPKAVNVIQVADDKKEEVMKDAQMD